VIYTTKPKIIQHTIISGLGTIEFSEGVALGVKPSPYIDSGEFYLEARTTASKVIIGKDVYINNNAVIIADKSSINIGNGTLIGTSFTCFDSNFHPIANLNRLTSDYSCKPVFIGENVFIGSNVTVLRGSIIGDNSVIGAGCVISGYIPENSLITVSNNVKSKLLF